MDSGEKLDMKVKDWNRVGGHKSLGSASVTVSVFPVGPKPKEIWLPLKVGPC